MPESSKGITPFKTMQQISRNLEAIITFKKAGVRADQEANIEKIQNKTKEDNTKAESPTSTVALAGIILAAGALATYLSTEISQIFDDLHKGFFDILGLTPKPEPEVDSTEALNLADIPAGPDEENINEIENPTILDIGDKDTVTGIKEIKDEVDAIEKAYLGFFNSIREFFGFKVQKPPAPPAPPKSASRPASSAPRQRGAAPAQTPDDANDSGLAAPPGTPTRRTPISGSRPPPQPGTPTRTGGPTPRSPGSPIGASGSPDESSGSTGRSTSSGSASSGATGNEAIMNQAMDDMGVKGNSQRAGLAAIIKGESGFKAISENMNYSAARAREVFKYEPAGGWEAITAKGPEAFAEEVYGYRTRNAGAQTLGNNKPGDGWKYRGRGFIQLTGKANYADIGKAIGVDLVNNPDALLDPLTAAKASIVYMQRRPGGLGSFDQQLAAVGGSQLGWANKRKYYEQYTKDGTFKYGVAKAEPTRTAASPPPETQDTAPTITVTENTNTNAQQTVKSPTSPASGDLNARNLNVASRVKTQDKASATLQRAA